MKFGTFLARVRQQAGYSQKQLASAIHWDQSYLSKIENNTRKLPSREMLVVIARRMNLSPEDTDQLLLSAQYQPLSLLEMGWDKDDSTLKKQVHILKEIRDSVALPSYLHAQEEIADFLELLRIKYLQKTNPSLTKNSLLADLIYAKVKRGGLKALSEMVSYTQGGAVIIKNGKLLLAPIGISPLKNIWHIPAGFVNPAKGDRTAQDIALRLAKRYLPKAEITLGNELTTKDGLLSNLDTTNYSLRLGYFPAPFQIFELAARGDLTPAEGAIFCAFSDIPAVAENLHPLLYEIIRPFVKNKRIIKKVYTRCEETIRNALQKRNYRQDMQKFYEQRIKKTTA